MFVRIINEAIVVLVVTSFIMALSIINKLLVYIARIV